VNPYAYVYGTPLMGVDPDGNNPLVFVGIAVAQYTVATMADGSFDLGSADWWKGAFITAASAAAGYYAGNAVSSAVAEEVGGGAALSAGAKAGVAAAGGAAGGAAGYATGAVLSGRGSTAGFGRAVASGGVSALVGSGDSGVGGAIASSSAGFVTNAALGGEASFQTYLLSVGSAVAGALLAGSPGTAREPGSGSSGVAPSGSPLSSDPGDYLYDPGFGPPEPGQDHERQRKARTLEGVIARQERQRILCLHQNAQRLIRPLFVVNPFAAELKFPDHQTRMRRDHMKYLGLIEAVALLHQYQRPVKTVEHRGQKLRYIEVTKADIEVANRLAHEVLGRSLDELPPQTRRLLGMLDELATAECSRLGLDRCDFRFSRRTVRERTGWSYEQLRVHLGRLVEFEYLLVHRGSRGQSFVYELWATTARARTAARFWRG
jgi:hypothetical protein